MRIMRREFLDFWRLGLPSESHSMRILVTVMNSSHSFSVKYLNVHFDPSFSDLLGSFAFSHTHSFSKTSLSFCSYQLLVAGFPHSVSLSLFSHFHGIAFIWASSVGIIDAKWSTEPFCFLQAISCCFWLWRIVLRMNWLQLFETFVLQLSKFIWISTVVPVL